MSLTGRIQPFRPGGTFEAFGRTARHWTVDAVVSNADWCHRSASRPYAVCTQDNDAALARTGRPSPVSHSAQVAADPRARGGVPHRHRRLNV